MVNSVALRTTSAPCPTCGADIPGDRVRCPRCGTVRAPAARSPERACRFCRAMVAVGGVLLLFWLIVFFAQTL